MYELVLKRKLVMGSDSTAKFLDSSLIIKNIMLFESGGGDIDRKVIIFPGVLDHNNYKKSPFSINTSPLPFSHPLLLFHLLTHQFVLLLYLLLI